MKNLFLILALPFFVYSFSVTAGDKPKAVKSEIKEVSVFLRGAQVTRTSNANINAGTSQLIFEELPYNMNAQSIQVSGKGDFTILSVQHHINYLKSQQISKEIKNIRDSIENLKDQLAFEKSMQLVYTEEENMIIANKAIGGQNVGVKIADLKEGAEYFRTRLTDINTKQLVITKKITKLNEEIARLSNQINSLNSRENKPSSEIILTVTAKNPVNASLSLSYLVNDAGWTPLYDLRAKDINNPVELTYKGNIWQTSGEDWDKIALTLNTGNPSISGTKPTLSPWFLYYYYYESSKKKGKLSLSKNVAATYSERDSKKDEGENFKSELKEQAAGSSADFSKMTETQTNIEFKIEVPYSIPSDGKKCVVEVQKISIPASYEYYCAPKLDKDAFLLAHVTGWEAYNLISGEMNLFFEGTYVGKSFLDAAETKDTLDISLGRDKNISVSRTKMKDFLKKSFIGSTKKETRGFEIEVKNKKKQAINLLIEDQFPLSTNKDIEIEALEKSDAKYNLNTGILSWKFELKPAESKKFKMQYSVKYPKEQTITLE